MPGLYTGANGLWGGFSGLIYGSSALSTPPGLLADAATGFTPASLFSSGEQGAWYDPSDFSSMFQDAAGTIPVTAVTQPVGRILDKSGRGNHATQSTNASRPILQQDGNGKYYLQFDGVDDFIEAPSFTMPGPYSAWAGARTSATTLQLIVNSDDGIAPYMPQYLRINGTFLESIAFSTGGVFTDAGPSVTTTSNFVLAANCTTTSVDATVNGTSNGATSITGTLNSQSRPLTIGRYTAGGFLLNGRVYGVILRGASSTAVQMSDAQNWMNGKTGAY